MTQIPRLKNCLQINVRISFFPAFDTMSLTFESFRSTSIFCKLSLVWMDHKELFFNEFVEFFSHVTEVKGCNGGFTYWNQRG
jgi:hypothetical protein